MQQIASRLDVNIRYSASPQEACIGAMTTHTLCCAAVSQCMPGLLMQTALCVQALENGNEASSGLGPAYTELTGHLSEASTSFFQHWLTLVELEEAPLQSKRAEIWKCTGHCLIPAISLACVPLLIHTPIAYADMPLLLCQTQMSRQALHSSVGHSHCSAWARD